MAAYAADRIVDMIGVNTHFAYADTVYRYLTPSNPAPNGNSILSVLRNLGVRHLRDGDGQMATNPALCNAFVQAGLSGTDEDILISLGDSAATIGAIAPCVGPGLRAVEGPNELDLAGDANFAADDVAAMSQLAGLRGTSFPSNVILVAPSLAQSCVSYQREASIQADAVANFIDANNAHIYFSGYNPENLGFGPDQCGHGPAGAISTFLGSASIAAPSKPIVVTETGYPDDCCSYTDTGFVAPAVKTKYTLRTLLSLYAAGVSYAYIYELASEAQSFGLTDQYLNPKPAYTALQNFIAILQDAGGSSVSGSVRLGFSSSFAPLGRQLFKKQDGSLWLVLWSMNSSWNPGSASPIENGSTAGSISFATTPSVLYLYTFSPTDGSVTKTSLSPSSPVSITVSDMPEIIQIGVTANPPALAIHRRALR